MKPIRKDFDNTPEGQKEFEAALQLWNDSQNKTVESPPQTTSRKVYLTEISEPIVRTFPAVGGQPVERKFRMLTTSDSEGNAGQIAVNTGFYDRIKSQLATDRYYDFTFEIRKAGVTTYKDAAGKVQKHNTSGETLTKFTPITERAFAGVQMSLTQKITTITNQPEGYSMAIASLLK